MTNIRKSRGKTSNFRIILVREARQSIMAINREYLHEWMENWNNKEYFLEQEDITKIIEALNHASDVLKEMERDLE